MFGKDKVPLPVGPQISEGRLPGWGVGGAGRAMHSPLLSLFLLLWCSDCAFGCVRCGPDAVLGDLPSSSPDQLKALQKNYGKLQQDVLQFQKNQTNLERKFSYDL